MSIGFASKISSLRREKNITQKDAAPDLGVSQALLSHYEKGIRECNLEFVKKAAVYYNVSADYLLGLSDTKHGNRDVFDEADIPDDLLLSAKEFTDTAIITLCRFSQEGNDRKDDGTEFYYDLSPKEKEMVKTVLENFEKVIVLLTFVFCFQFLFLLLLLYQNIHGYHPYN